MNTYNEERLKAIEIIESLRSGVPSRALMSAVDDLRPQVLNLIRGDLDRLLSNDVPEGRLIWAGYGQGKSHFLRMAEQLALGKNFAVSYVTLNRQVSLNNLTRFYQIAAPFIRTPDSNIPGLMNQLSRVDRNVLTETPIQNQERYVHPLPAIVVELLLHSSEEDFHSLYHHLMGDFLPIAEVRRLARIANLEHLLRQVERFKQEHIPAHFGVLEDVIRLCGYRGWVILIDETELIGRLGRVSRLSAYRNLNWLLNWRKDMICPVYTLAAVASSLQQDVFSSSNRREGDRDTIPRIAGERFGQEVEEEMTKFFNRALIEDCPTLTAFGDNQLIPLLQQIAEWYRRAFTHEREPQPDWLNQVMVNVKGKPVRTYIRATLEVLDHYYLTGRIIPVQPDLLIEHPMEEKQDNNVVEQ